MRILIVTNDVNPYSIDLAKYKKLAFEDEITVHNGFNSGKEYVQNFLITGKKHIDFIIVTRQYDINYDKWEFEENLMQEFAIWIRNLSETYSSDNFQIKKIPLILDDASSFYKNIIYENQYLNFYDLVTYTENQSPERIATILGKPLNDWLNKLGEDLDRMNLDTNFNFGKSLVHEKDSFDVEILSQGFFKRAQMLNYVWIGDNIKKLYVDADLFKKMLDQSSKNKNLRNEKEYHNFFKNNPGLLLGDQYCKTIYENQFYYENSRKYVEPDFVNIPFTYSFKTNQIFEVKLPNQRLYNYRTNNESSYLKKSLTQVGQKYFDYFDKSMNSAQIKKGMRLNHIPSYFEYTLLIGRLEDKEENLSKINNYIASENQSLDIITYDELLSKYQRTYKRVQRFNLK